MKASPKGCSNRAGFYLFVQFFSQKYCLLPTSYLALGMVRDEKVNITASVVCSVLMIVCLVAFGCVAGIVA